MKREYLWHINRRSVAVAVAVGLFCAFMPIPVQMLLAAAVAIALRANLPIAVVMVWVTNPLTMTPIFFFCYKIGQQLFTWIGEIFYFEPSFEWLDTGFSAIWQPLLLGSLVVGSFVAILGYSTVLFLWRYNIINHWHRRKKNRCK